MELLPDLVLKFSSEGFRNVMAGSISYPHMSCFVSSEVEPSCVEQASGLWPSSKLLLRYRLPWRM